MELTEPKILNDVMETSHHNFLVSAWTRYTLYKQLGKQPVVMLLFYKIFGRSVRDWANLRSELVESRI